MSSNIFRKYANIIAEASVFDKPETIGYYLWNKQKGKVSPLMTRPRYVWEYAHDELGILNGKGSDGDTYYCVRVDPDGHHILDANTQQEIGTVPNPPEINEPTQKY